MAYALSLDAVGDSLRRAGEAKALSELLEQARSLGRRVYAESPKAFRKWVRRYVRAVA
jgi:hypothetical protein